ncbi:unnamed protein product [Effrenium voratum]|nr:unnamed protein product [Effrenium voratum]
MHRRKSRRHVRLTDEADIEFPAMWPVCGRQLGSRLWARAASLGRGLATGSGEIEVLTATAVSEVSKLGGAIAGRIRKDSRTSIRCVGHQAAFRSVKAVVNASEYLSQDDSAPKGRMLGIQVAEMDGRREGGNELRLQIGPVMLQDSVAASGASDSSGSSGSRSHDLLISGKTAPGKAAAAMAAAMRPMGGGHGRCPLVRAMGSMAVHRALVTGHLAQKYLDNDRRGVRFCLIPYFSRHIATEDGKKQLVLRLQHLPSEASALKGKDPAGKALT